MELDNLKYNYVICGAGGYYDFGYRDVMNLPNVRYYSRYDGGVRTKLEKFLIRFNFSKKVNRFLKTPFGHVVYPIIYKPDFYDTKPLCFIFFGNVEYVYQTSYLKFLRKKYPDVKIVLYMQDLIHKNPQLDFNRCKCNFDLILSYDRGDCLKYDLHFHPTPMSQVVVEEDNLIEESDVYFCGYAKSRYQLINDLYMRYTSYGLKCDFNIMKYPTDAPRVDGIKYHDCLFTYEQNIQHILKTKAILEVMQDGADGFTPRVWESIIYDKHLITSNTSLINSEFYDRMSMHIYNDISLVDNIFTPVAYSLNKKQQLSPIHLLKYIDNILS